MNLKDLNDEDLDQLRMDVAIEQENRILATSLPLQIEDLAARYKHITGDSAPPVQAAERGVGRSDES